MAAIDTAINRSDPIRSIRLPNLSTIKADANVARNWLSAM